MDRAIVSEGVKHDAEKIQVELLDAEWLEGVGDILTFGAKKYAAHNWRNGLSFTRLLGACLRHLFAFARGQDLDPETGKSHLLHAACCLMFLYWMWVHRKDMDDRWRRRECKLTECLGRVRPCKHLL